jgi:2-hydroxychromene-2-carboxylate isomerase
MDPTEPPQPLFLLDLTDPWSYLAAERINSTLSVVPEWEPVIAAEAGAELAAVSDRDGFAAAAAEAALLPLRWPPVDGGDARLAALAGAFAKGGGRAVAFALALLRQQFAGGRAPDEATVLLAGAACEIHPAAVLKGITLRATADRLQRAHVRARELSVPRLPAVAVGDAVFAGPDCVERAAVALTPTR